MATKPYFGTLYMDKTKSFEENYGNYRRDLLLWEQAEAMEKMQKAQEETLRKIQNNYSANSNIDYYTSSTDYRVSDDYIASDEHKLFEINFDIHSTETDKKILGKKIDDRIEALFMIIKYKMKMLEFWAKVKEIILILILFAVSVSWIAIPLIWGNTNSSDLLKNSIIACTVAIITLLILSIVKISSTKNKIFKLYEEKIKIEQELKAKKKNKMQKKAN